MRLIGITLIATLAATGCASAPSNQAAQITEADETMVAGCEFLGSVYGKTVYGGMANDLAVNNAKNNALEKAVKLGATHIVYTELSGGNVNRTGHVTARAYRCER